MLSGRGLCDELITRPEESYRLWCVVVCDLETSRIGAPYINDISTLRVKDANCLHHVHMKVYKQGASTVEACMSDCESGKVEEQQIHTNSWNAIFQSSCVYDAFRHQRTFRTSSAPTFH